MSVSRERDAAVHRRTLEKKLKEKQTSGAPFRLVAPAMLSAFSEAPSLSVVHRGGRVFGSACRRHPFIVCFVVLVALDDCGHEATAELIASSIE